MKTKAFLCLLLLILSGRPSVSGKTAPGSSPRVKAARNNTLATSAENVFNLADFGAIGDGVADAGPALQNALDAMAEAGGGTLLVPAGRYAIVTPVQKNFSGLASDITILGVESLTPVPPPNSSGQQLSRGLDLTSEFAPRTGEQAVALNITGLQKLLIKDITFIGTPGVLNDALITLALADISEATIRHCEFYGLSSLVAGAAIVQAVRSNLAFEQSVVLGSTCSSGVNSPVIQNLEWKGITISEAVFLDYGQRAELFGKMNTAPHSWINIGNAAVTDNDSPRREVVVRSVFLDEGGFFGITSLPYLHTPASAPIDLIYITGLHMNVSNFGTAGHYIYGAQRVLIEKSHYGWSQDADSAINLLTVGNAILDQVECVASADRIRADSATGKLTVIDSVYNHLDSLAQTTRVVTTNVPGEDPVQYVRQQFNATLGPVPDPAAHFYWSDQILQCGADSQCAAAKRAALGDYLAAAPPEKFAVSGRVIGETGNGMVNVTVTLSGSQNVTTQTDAEGRYHFSNLPTSGVYVVTPSRNHHTLSPLNYQIVTPASDQIFNSTATLNLHDIGGRVTDEVGNALQNVTVTLSGSELMTVTTDANGEYLFHDLPGGGNYTVTPRKTSHRFSLTSQSFQDLATDQSQNFTGTFLTYSIYGITVNPNNYPIPGVTVTLSGSQNRTTTSDQGGNFSFTALPSEGTYTVTPSLPDHSFNTPWRTFFDLAEDQYSSYVAAAGVHSIIGSVTHSDGSPLSNAIISLSGNASGTATTDQNGDYYFANLPQGGNYTLTLAKARYTFDHPTQTFTSLNSNQIANFDAGPHSEVEFSASDYTVSEGMKTITATLTRTGGTSRAPEVVYSATNGSANQRSDVIPVMGKVSFAPNETSKTFTVFITDDAHVEGDESITLELSDPVAGILGNKRSATLTITDNDSEPAVANPIDNAEFFVRQQYRDFLNREPDEAGLAFWSNQILSCGTDEACHADRRINVSAAFFLSIESQETGFLVYRLYRASYAQPPQHLDEFLLDTRRIAEGVIVNAPGWQQLLQTNTSAVIEDFVSRSRFTAVYPTSLTPVEFVNLLNGKIDGTLSSDELAGAIAEFGGAANTSSVAARARALRRIAENGTFSQHQLNSAFVLMQYFGYLQRNPSDPPNTNLDGYNFWLTKLNQFNGNFVQAEMVKAFLNSGEYRERFAP